MRVLCSVDELDFCYTSCNTVARRAWLRAEEAASRVEGRGGLFRCKTPDPKLNLMEATPIAHFGEEVPMFLITFLNE